MGRFIRDIFSEFALCLSYERAVCTADGISDFTFSSRFSNRAFSWSIADCRFRRPVAPMVGLSVLGHTALTICTCRRSDSRATSQIFCTSRALSCRSFSSCSTRLNFRARRWPEVNFCSWTTSFSYCVTFVQQEASLIFSRCLLIRCCQSLNMGSVSTCGSAACSQLFSRSFVAIVPPLMQ